MLNLMEISACQQEFLNVIVAIHQKRLFYSFA